jgi:hypothetical protein
LAVCGTTGTAYGIRTAFPCFRGGGGWGLFVLDSGTVILVFLISVVLRLVLGTPIVV